MLKNQAGSMKGCSIIQQISKIDTHKFSKLFDILTLSIHHLNKISNEFLYRLFEMQLTNINRNIFRGNNYFFQLIIKIKKKNFFFKAIYIKRSNKGNWKIMKI